MTNGSGNIEKSAHNQNSGGNNQNSGGNYMGTNFILLWVPLVNQLKEGRQHVLYMYLDMKDTEGVNNLSTFEGKKKDP